MKNLLAAFLISLLWYVGGGGLYVCVDTAGVLYKKSNCPG